MENYGGADARRVAYLSAEFLLGPHLANNLLNLGITEATREAMRGLGYDLDEILAQEEEPGLGNGGLGRLAACYMDSLASVEVPAVGYGIRYEFGIFDQAIRDGWQCEITDKWLRNGNPWEIARSEIALRGEVRRTHRAVHRRAGPLSRALDSGDGGEGRRLRHADRSAIASAPATRCGSGKPRPSSHSISRPSIMATTTARSRTRCESETITKVLYPNDEAHRGQGAPPQAAVLFLELLAAGHAAHPRAARRHAGDFPRKVGGAAQRHASGGRGRGTDAPARG